MLPVKYDMVIKMMDAEEEFYVEELDGHKPVCYYAMNNIFLDKQNAIFEKPHLGMNSHLKPLFIKVIVDNYGVNKFLVNIGATISLMSHSLLSKMEKFDTDLKPYNMVLYNYEGKVNHFLWEI